MTLSADVRASLGQLLADISLDEEKPYTEALFLTFSSDLGFFEQQVLGLARRAGTVPTVIADRRVYSPDPRAVHSAGIHYQVCLTAGSSLFHPKVMLFAGPDKALAAVGSGNLTTSGWFLNQETLTVLRGTRADGTPAALTELADWLAALPGEIVLGEGAAAAVQRTVDLVKSLPRSQDVGEAFPRILHNLESPLAHQLPPERIDELRLYAPFHDLSATAVHWLVGRFRPDVVRIAIDTSTTVCDPQAIDRVVSELGASAVFERLADLDGYHHGKVVEGVVNGMVAWTLTGSPNVSGAALLGTATGNCELAVIDESGTSLFPRTSERLAVEALRPLPSGPSAYEEQPPAALVDDGLVEVRLVGDELRLTFARPTTTGWTLQLSTFEHAPEDFTDHSTLPPGEQDVVVQVDKNATRPNRVRLFTDRAVGPVHFVMHPVPLARRPGARVASNVNVGLTELCSDLWASQNWLSMLMQLSEQLSRTPRVATLVASPAVGEPGNYTGAVWGDVVDVDAKVAKLGHSMAGFVLGGLPQLVAPASEAPAWVDNFSKTVTEPILDREGEPIDSPEDDEPLDPDESAASSRAREVAHQRALRDWLSHQALKAMSTADLDLRMALAGVILHGIRMDIWPARESAPWFDLLADAIELLSQSPAPYEEFPETARALTQVMFAELIRGAHEFDREDDALRVRRRRTTVERQVVPLLTPVTRECLEFYVKALPRSYAAPLYPDDVAYVAERASETDPAAREEDALQALDSVETVLVDGFRVDLTTSAREPMAACGEALEVVAGTRVVFATNPRGRRAVMARHSDLMVTAEAHGVGVRYRTYQLDALSSPRGIGRRRAHGEDGVNPIETAPLGRCGPRGAEVLSACRASLHEIGAYLAGKEHLRSTPATHSIEADPAPGVRAPRSATQEAMSTAPPEHVPQVSMQQCELCDMPMAFCVHGSA